MNITAQEARAELARLIETGAHDQEYADLMVRVDATSLTDDGELRAEIIDAWVEAEAGTPEAIHCQRCGGQHFHAESTCEG